MDCKNARMLLEFEGPLRSELDPAEAAALHDHLEQCLACRELAEGERRLDAAMGRAMRDVPIPPALRTRLMTRLDAERDAFYKRFGMKVTAAAAVLAVLTIWLAARAAQAPREAVERGY